MRDSITTFVFTLVINSIISYLETMPNYSCPSYCGVEHKHYNNRKEENDNGTSLQRREQKEDSSRVKQKYQYPDNK